MDEMRYGTRTIVAKKWMSKGNRPTTPMKYGYKYSYLFQATLHLPPILNQCSRIFSWNEIGFLTKEELGWSSSV